MTQNKPATSRLFFYLTRNFFDCTTSIGDRQFFNLQEGNLSDSTAIVRGEPGFVDPFNVCVFRQVRDGEESHYQGITELAESIAGNHLLTPLTICVWDEATTEQYAQLIRQIFNGDGGFVFEAEQPYADGKNRVLVAGHRRRQALHRLRFEGSDVYRQNFPEQSSEECFLDQFKGDRNHPLPGFVPAMIYTDIPAERGVSLQLEENINRRNISSPTQAKAIKGLYDLKALQQGDAGLSMAEFARQSQISLNVVRDALRFCELPKSIRYAVENGAFKWSCALELTVIHRMLRERPKPDGTLRDAKEVEYTLLSLSASEAASKNLQAFRKYLQTWVTEVLGQLVMFEELALTPQQIATQLLGDEMVRGSAEHTIFLQRVTYALKNGWIRDGKLVPLHRHEARKAIAAILAEQRALLPMLQLVLDQATAEELENLGTDSQKALDAISALAVNS